MDNKISLLLILGLILLGVASFLIGIPQAVYDFSLNLAQGRINIRDVQFYGLLGFLLLSIIFAISSFILSKRKNRNVLAWTALGSLFNVWTFLLLYFLPSRK